ncbi:putative glutathione S-transferase [Chitinasiproducens palmae]|uniref:Putative glutathione S-transferase n=2 Tax=Chitinasiproducens palmae TaxID=1770053 RepID=A0A1H2PVA6_9BURK|nr:putative glutathione S-transferase [Chitinasiproducens palmae]
MLIEGKWRQESLLASNENGRFVRAASPVRHWVSADGAPGPTGDGGFAAEAGRYLLYISRACPWAHRATIMRALKGLDAMVGLAIVNPVMGEQGWTFAPGPGVLADPVAGAPLLADVYTRSDARYTGRVVVPVLWDLSRDRIVSNESADIMRMFNRAFDGLGARPGDYYPEALRAEIDELNERIYTTLNNGVYRAGFASTQAAYDEAVGQLFDTLDWLEARLGGQRYLCGDAQTEADWRLFPTLLRFDLVYHGHFKCNLRRLVDYPNLWSYTRELYRTPGIAATVDIDHIKRHYYLSHPQLDPSGIVPAGPLLDLDAPPTRALAGQRASHH